MGPLIILLAVGIIAAALAAMVWRNRSGSARRDTGGESIGDSATFYDSGAYGSGAETSADAASHCSDGGADSSGDCGGDGGGSSGD
jgi:hypothetical protein